MKRAVMNKVVGVAALVLACGSAFADGLTGVAPEQFSAAKSFWNIYDGQREPGTHAPVMTAEGASSQVDALGHGRLLFLELYDHRLSATKGLDHLIEEDAQVRSQLREYTTEGVLSLDIGKADPLAVEAAMKLLGEAIQGSDRVQLKGEYQLHGDVLTINDLRVLALKDADGEEYVDDLRLGLRSSPPQGPDCSGNGLRDRVTDLVNQSGLDPASGCLYHSDSKDNSDPGFDCDDFADAQGAFITNAWGSDCGGATYKSADVAWEYTDSNGKTQTVGHALTVIEVNGIVIVVDAQTGTVRGPTDRSIMSDSKRWRQMLQSASNRYLHTQQNRDTFHPTGVVRDPNSRKPYKTEPPVWFTDSAEVSAFCACMNVSAGDCKEFVEKYIKRTKTTTRTTQPATNVDPASEVETNRVGSFGVVNSR